MNGQLAAPRLLISMAFWPCFPKLPTSNYNQFLTAMKAGEWGRIDSRLDTGQFFSVSTLAYVLNLKRIYYHNTHYTTFNRSLIYTFFLTSQEELHHTASPSWLCLSLWAVETFSQPTALSAARFSWKLNPEMVPTRTMSWQPTKIVFTCTPYLENRLWRRWYSKTTFWNVLQK